MVNYKKEIFIINNKEYDIFIGKNAQGNEEIIKLCDKYSIWFHFDDISSSHIILDSKGDKISKEYLKKVGILLYKYTKNIPRYTKIVYTTLNNVNLTDDIGTVILSNYKFL
jgi:predicted ribosome quality control (RQC) complex YloA/Tae2 family protein